MPSKKIKTSIDFIQKMWYYILKERKPRTSREAGTATSRNSRKESHSDGLLSLKPWARRL